MFLPPDHVAGVEIDDCVHACNCGLSGHLEAQKSLLSDWGWPLMVVSIHWVGSSSSVWILEGWGKWKWGVEVHWLHLVPMFNLQGITCSSCKKKYIGVPLRCPLVLLVMLFQHEEVVGRLECEEV